MQRLWLWVPDQTDPVLNPMSSQFSIPVLWNLRLKSVGGMKIWDPVEDSDSGGPISITIRMEY